MSDRRYSADEIIDRIDSGDKDQAKSRLNYDFLHMRPDEFKKLVADMEQKTGNDADNWNNVYSEKDSAGNITAVYINDGYLFDTKLFDRKDYSGNAANALGAMTRALGGALDQGKRSLTSRLTEQYLASSRMDAKWRISRVLF